MMFASSAYPQRGRHRHLFLSVSLEYRTVLFVFFRFGRFYSTQIQQKTNTISNHPFDHSYADMHIKDIYIYIYIAKDSQKTKTHSAK